MQIEQAVAAQGAVDRAATFLNAFERVGGHGHLADNLGEARQILSQIVRERGIENAVTWQSPVLEALDLASLFRTCRGPAEGSAGFRAACAEAGVGITSAALGAADTGTLLLPFGPARPRSVCVLPPVWIAVVPAERLVDGRPELFAYIRSLAVSDRIPGEMGLITGPSRTGDIESLLLQGIHGPGDAHVLIVRNTPSDLREEHLQ